MPLPERGLYKRSEARKTKAVIFPIQFELFREQDSAFFASNQFDISNLAVTLAENNDCQVAISS